MDFGNVWTTNRRKKIQITEKLNKIGFYLCAADDARAHSPMHASLLDTTGCPTLTPPLVFCQRLRFPSSRASCTTEAPLPVSSSFPLVEKEQINRTNKTRFLVHACVNMSSSVSIVAVPEQVFHFFLNNFGSNLRRRSSGRKKRRQRQ